jgi:OOP family OmpA-OmpF porin
MPYPKVNIMITGYQAMVGDAAANLKLSVRRAFAVYNWHVNQGIPSPRMQYKGMGESNPIASNATKEGQEKNQRVEVCVLKKK